MLRIQSVPPLIPLFGPWAMSRSTIADSVRPPEIIAYIRNAIWPDLPSSS